MIKRLIVKNIKFLKNFEKFAEIKSAAIVKRHDANKVSMDKEFVKRIFKISCEQKLFRMTLFRPNSIILHVGTCLTRLSDPNRPQATQGL